MIYLSGKAMPYCHPRLGFMSSPDHTRGAPENQWWAADNACFAHEFDEPRWRLWLTKCQPWLNRNLFAVAPDVVGNAQATLIKSAPHYATIRELGYKPAFVSQDGLQLCDVPWDEFDAIFVGGTDAWKFCEASSQITLEAKQRGKWVHVGRVNSLRKAIASGVRHQADSVDGTHIRYEPDKALVRVLRWLGPIDAE